MAGELGDMYDAAKDYVGDLAHHAYDTVKGALAPASAPSKPAYTGTQASGSVGKDFDNKIDKAVQDAGG